MLIRRRSLAGGLRMKVEGELVIYAMTPRRRCDHARNQAMRIMVTRGRDESALHGVHVPVDPPDWCPAVWQARLRSIRSGASATVAFGRWSACTESGVPATFATICAEQQGGDETQS